MTDMLRPMKKSDIARHAYLVQDYATSKHFLYRKQLNILKHAARFIWYVVDDAGKCILDSSQGRGIFIFADTERALGFIQDEIQEGNFGYSACPKECVLYNIIGMANQNKARLYFNITLPRDYTPFLLYEPVMGSDKVNMRVQSKRKPVT